VLFGEALLAQRPGDGDVAGAAGRMGASVALGRHIVASGALLRELGGDMGGYVETSANYDLGRLHLGALAHLEVVSGVGRDPVDLVAVAAASWRVAAPLYVGLQYVAQDLEEALDDEQAEGGPRHYVGPALTLALGGHMMLTTDAAIGIAVGRSSPVVARSILAFTY
jgi:hypothetical protein